MTSYDQEPDFAILGFKLWVSGWERDSDEFWDNNWIVVTARFKSGPSTITVGGGLLHSTDIEYAESTLKALSATFQGVAEFSSMDPGFDIKLEALTGGRIAFHIEMNPGPDETYEYSCEIDQSYLPPALAMLQELMAKYGPRGDRPVAPQAN